MEARESRALAGDADAASLGKLNRFRLTFVDPRTEKEFARNSKERLLNDLFLAGILVSALGTVMLILLLAVFPRSEESPTVRVWQFLVGLWIIGNALFTAVGARLKGLTNTLDQRHLELFAVCELLTLIVSAVLLAPQYLPRLIGAKPAGPKETDTFLLLTLTGIAMASHLGLRCRWHMLIPVQIACVLGYALPAMVLESPHGREEATWYVIILAELVGFASHGSRVIQRQERQAFVHLIQEKARRFSSEFQLSQLRSSGGAIPEEEALSVAESAPTTTDTGRAFEVGQAPGGGSPLQGIQDIGWREQWLVQGNELSCMPDSIIGVGGFGIVIRGEYQGVPVAVKLPKAAPQAALLRSPSSLVELCNELRILRRLRHPNIVIFYAAWLDTLHTDIAIVLELVNGVSLRSFVGDGPTGVERAEVLPQISCALLYLHKRYPQIVHGDLKDTNIFVVSSGDGARTAKLLDFGLARRITKHVRPLGGSLRWMAPEVLQRRSRGAASAGVAADVFSMGRVVHFVATGSVAGEGKGGSEVVRDLKRNVLPELHWPLASPLGDDCKDLVGKCHQAAPESRPGIAEVHAVLVHIWRKHARVPEPPEQHTDLHRQIGRVRQIASKFKSQAAIQLVRRAAAPGYHQMRTPGSVQSDDGATTGTRTDHVELIYPGWELTPTTTDSFLMSRSLHRCNFRIDTRACCQYHAAMERMRSIVAELSSKDCRPVAEGVLGQCAACGVIVTANEVDSVASLEGQECDVCGEVLTLQGSKDGVPEDPQQEHEADV